MLFIQIAKSKALLIGTESDLEYFETSNFVATAPSSSDFIQPIRSVSSGRDAEAARVVALNVKRQSIRIAVASILTLTSLIHLTVGVVLTLYSAIMNRYMILIINKKFVNNYYFLVFI